MLGYKYVNIGRTQNEIFGMIQIFVRVPEENCIAIKRIALERRESESAIWREIIEIGLRNYKNAGSAEQQLQMLLELTFRTAVQSLTVSRRLAGHFDEDLVVEAREDAVAIIESAGVRL
jgi:hypothetical protein